MLSSRKPLEECGIDHRARMKRLYEKARHDHSLNSTDMIREDIVAESDSMSNNNNSLHLFNDEEITDDFSNNGAIDSNSASSVGTVNPTISDDNFSSVCSEFNENLEDFENRLAISFTDCNMTHKQINHVLLVLKTHRCFWSLHRDARTILKTPVIAHPTDKIAGGEYLHLGVANSLLKILSLTLIDDIPDFLQLDISTDQASLDKQSKILMWPIQVRIDNISKSAPEIVGIFKGSRKPTSASEKPGQHLQQIANRRAEDCQVNRRKSVDSNSLQFVGKHFTGPEPLIDCIYSQYRKVIKGLLQISLLQQDRALDPAIAAEHRSQRMTMLSSLSTNSSIMQDGIGKQQLLLLSRGTSRTHKILTQPRNQPDTFTPTHNLSQVKTAPQQMLTSTYNRARHQKQSHNSPSTLTRPQASPAQTSKTPDQTLTSTYNRAHPE
ncbi:hypothetical protein TSAR_001465 [Trichomalopsis sarcophagae]|uniref:Uncharacterized protein n=1 Tax=Trichomalopsis sarcophagae TaxID=543379 RepID=A0A232EMD9_9HYME|nr:hypothetical protein TSAR_001465 [Trichomalopsis sarcophagae]